METESEFLNWIADRLVHVHKEPSNVEFITKLRRIAKTWHATSENQKAIILKAPMIVKERDGFWLQLEDVSIRLDEKNHGSLGQTALQKAAAVPLDDTMQNLGGPYP